MSHISFARWVVAAATVLLAACGADAGDGAEDSFIDCQCGFGEGCGTGECVPAALQRISIAESVVDDATNGQITSSLIPARELMTYAELGTCRVEDSSGFGDQLPPATAADLVIESATLGSETVPAGEAIMLDDVFQPGENIHLSSAGGTTFPPFELDLVGPDTMSLVSVSETEAGGPLTVDWDAGNGQMVVDLLVPGDPEIRCTDLPDTGSYTVDDSLMTYMADAAQVQVLLHRRDRHRFSPEGSDTTFDILATSNTSSTLVR